MKINNLTAPSLKPTTLITIIVLLFIWPPHISSAPRGPRNPPRHRRQRRPSASFNQLSSRAPPPRSHPPSTFPHVLPHNFPLSSLLPHFPPNPQLLHLQSTARHYRVRQVSLLLHQHTTLSARLQRACFAMCKFSVGSLNLPPVLVSHHSCLGYWSVSTAAAAAAADVSARRHCPVDALRTPTN
jgi:hypothetical protein